MGHTEHGRLVESIYSFLLEVHALHSVTCHPTRVNAIRPNLIPQAGTRFPYTSEGWKAELT